MLEEKRKKKSLEDWKLENWVKEKKVFFLLRKKYYVMYGST